MKVGLSNKNSSSQTQGSEAAFGYQRPETTVSYAIAIIAACRLDESRVRLLDPHSIVLQSDGLMIEVGSTGNESAIGQH
jgi:hypothetical protein